VQFRDGTVNINDGVFSIPIRHSREDIIELECGESSRKSTVFEGRNLVPVEPASNLTDLEPRTHQAVSGLVTKVGLELGCLSGILVRHFNEVRGPLALADQVVIHNATGAKLERGGGNDGGGRGLPV
jgi:hypothetical protein